jgi:hypothetical protein
VTARASDLALRDRDLLLAILGAGDASLMAWSRWQRSTDIEALTPAEFRLQPALFRRLEVHAISHPWMTRLRGVYRYCWTGNQLTRRDLLTVHNAFQQEGVNAVAPGGLPLVHALYGDVAARMVESVEFVVAPEHAGAAHAVLTELGWTPRCAPPPSFLRSVLGPSVYTRVSHRHVVLHWHCAPAPATPALNRSIVARHCSVEMEGARVPLLDVADLLVRSCVHQTPTDTDCLLEWAPDALLLLRQLHVESRTHTIWDHADALGVGGRFAARIEQLSALVGDTLPYVPAVPPHVVRRDDPHVWVLLDPPTSMHRRRRAAGRAMARYGAWTISTGASRSSAGLVRFLAALYRYEWGVPAWRLPFVLARRLIMTSPMDTAPTGNLPARSSTPTDRSEPSRAA